MSESDFKLVKPLPVTDAGLTSSSVPETTVTEWSAAISYPIAVVRGVAGPNNSQDVYTSIAGGYTSGNFGNAPASSPSWWRYEGKVYGTYSSGATYAKDDIVTDTAAHQLYQSLVASNTGNALSDATKWLPLGNTNRWKMFDKAVNSQSTRPESVSVIIQLNELLNTLTLLNVSGASATVSQSSSGYSRTKSLVHHDVLNWYDWFFTEPVRSGNVVFDDIPPYKNAALNISVSNPGGTAAIGCCFIGKSYTLGTTLWDLTGGILSYSTTTTDTFGNTTMVKRANAKRLNFDVVIPAGYESAVYNLLTQYTDEELVFIGTTAYDMAIGYGYLGQWEVPVSNSGKPANIEMRGLV